VYVRAREKYKDNFFLTSRLFENSPMSSMAVVLVSSSKKRSLSVVNLFCKIKSMCLFSRCAKRESKPRGGWELEQTKPAVKLNLLNVKRFDFEKKHFGGWVLVPDWARTRLCFV